MTCRRIILLEKGGIIALLNLLIEHGLPAVDALRFATLNAAIRLQRHDLGLIAAGRRADLVVFDSLEKLVAREVYVGGKAAGPRGQPADTDRARRGRHAAARYFADRPPPRR